MLQTDSFNPILNNEKSRIADRWHSVLNNEEPKHNEGSACYQTSATISPKTHREAATGRESMPYISLSDGCPSSLPLSLMATRVIMDPPRMRTVGVQTVAYPVADKATSTIAEAKAATAGETTKWLIPQPRRRCKNGRLRMAVRARKQIKTSSNIGRKGIRKVAVMLRPNPVAQQPKKPESEQHTG